MMETQTLRVINVCVLHMLLWFGNCQNTAGLNKFSYFTKGLKDHVCVADDVIETIATTSNIHCLVNCGLNPTCLGVFYLSGDGACMMCNQSYTTTSGLASYPGMQYYRSCDADGFYVWSSWGPCSHTCGGGTRTRTRSCPTAEETASCHEFSCSTHATTCAGLVALGLNESCTAEIDPDGSGTQFGPISVVCDLDSDPGKAITVVHHGQESRTHVSGFESCGEYSAIINYSVGFEAAKAIADSSAECKQYVKYECHHAEILNCTFWKNRSLAQSTYFTQQHISGKVCECGHTGTCADSDDDCNCDVNDYVWRFDDGYVTNKLDLPIYSFHAGDTGILDRYTGGCILQCIVEYIRQGYTDYEEGYHTIGPMLCWDV